MSKLHEKGEPCPVIELLYERFGEELGGYLLWNETCFPFDDETALKQAKKLVSKADRKERVSKRKPGTDA